MRRYKRLLLIVNPYAGQTKRDSGLFDIILTFSEFDYESIVCITKEAGDACNIVERHSQAEIDMIVCMGGDGTLSEAVAGCHKVGWDKPLGYIPSGSTNDFAATLGLPSDPAEAARYIMTRQARYLDIGSFNGHLFIYTASLGIFTKASYETPQIFKNVLGHFAYILEGMKDLTQIRPQHLKVIAENKVYEDNYIFAAICNTFSLGGIMNLGNDVVDLNDGLFEIMLISTPHDLWQLREIIKALNEQNYTTPHISFFKTDHAKIENKEKGDWSLDGERGIGQVINEFYVIPRGIRMIY